MKNKKLINRGKKRTLHKDDSFLLSLISPWKRKENRKTTKKVIYNKGYTYLVTHPSTVSAEQDLTLLSRRKHVAVLVVYWTPR